MKVILIVLLLFLFTGCKGLLGTATGNPKSVPAINEIGISPYTPEETLSFTVCNLVKNCNDEIEFYDCFNPLVSAIELDEIEANSCSIEISQLSCDNENVVATYNPDLENPFMGIVDLLELETTECKNIFIEEDSN